MNREVLHILISAGLPRDYSPENREKVLKMAVVILEVNQKVIQKGIGILEDYLSKYPLLNRGLQLIRMGLEPELTETLLLNAAIADNTDLLTALAALEGIHGIQTAQLPQTTKELLKSHFPLEFEAEFEEEIAKSSLNIGSTIISRQEVERLINSAKSPCHSGGTFLK